MFWLRNKKINFCYALLTKVLSAFDYCAANIKSSYQFNGGLWVKIVMLVSVAEQTGLSLTLSENP